MRIKNILRHPLLYQWFQEAGGFFGARIKAIDAYLKIEPGDRIIDIGCGPGFLAAKLPDGVNYTGFDTDRAYIDFAEKRFGTKGRFVRSSFDHTVAEKFGPADIVMMNGLLHHLSDEEVKSALEIVAKALRKGGVLFTLDGCYVSGQSAVSRYLLRNDRGAFVRTEVGYTKLLCDQFYNVEKHVDSTLSRVPYTFIITVSRNPI